VDDKEITLIDDAYNANPASMKAGLESLTFYSGRKIAVLGDMLELGEEGQKRHLDLLDILSHNGVEKVFAVGKLMRVVFELLPEQQRGAWCETVEQMMPVLLNSLQNQDIVYIKSSHGTGLYKLVDKLKGK
jgi:UDP-N-acetylmuramoyl-tripeptide--D-alanyl-D-alanine ligase